MDIRFVAITILFVISTLAVVITYFIVFTTLNKHNMKVIAKQDKTIPARTWTKDIVRCPKCYIFRMWRNENEQARHAQFGYEHIVKCFYCGYEGVKYL